MWAPLQGAADSEEEVASEWTLWKKLHEISYDEKVGVLKRQFTQILKIQNTTGDISKT